jgi:hypothetical protein
LLEESIGQGENGFLFVGLELLGIDHSFDDGFIEQRFCNETLRHCWLAFGLERRVTTKPTRPPPKFL